MLNSKVKFNFDGLYGRFTSLLIAIFTRMCVKWSKLFCYIEKNDMLKVDEIKAILELKKNSWVVGSLNSNMH